MTRVGSEQSLSGALLYAGHSRDLTIVPHQPRGPWSFWRPPRWRATGSATERLYSSEIGDSLQINKCLGFV
jgi:hypothetical protein